MLTARRALGMAYAAMAERGAAERRVAAGRVHAEPNADAGSDLTPNELRKKKERERKRRYRERKRLESSSDGS